MSSSLTFFSLISGLISEANDGLNQALELSSDQPTVFVAPKVEIFLRCSVIENKGIKVVASNAFEANYYRDTGDSQLKLTFKLKPR